MKQVIGVKHAQEDGTNVVRIIAPAGYEYMIGRWKIEASEDTFRSAVDSLWSGYMKAVDMYDHFGKMNIRINSTVEGALDAFAAELESE